MSDIPADPIDLRAVLARIDRDLAEQAKLRAEAGKLEAEHRKLAGEVANESLQFAAQQRHLAGEAAKFEAEQRKLLAEEYKLRRDASIAPWQLTVAMLGSIGALIAALVAALRSFGVL